METKRQTDGENKTINLGFVIGQLTFGGAEKQLYELLVRLDGKKFRPVVFCLSESDKPFGDKIREQNITVHTLKRRSGFDIFRLLKLASLFKKEKIEAVHSILYIATAYSYYACKLSGIKNLIPTILGYTHRKSLLIRWVDKVVLNSVEKITTNSLDLKNYIVEKMGCDPDKIIILRNGIDLDIFNAPVEKDLIREKIGLTPDQRVIGIISRDYPVKNIPLFIQTAKNLLKQKKDICFVLVGVGLDERNKNEWLGDYGLKDKFYFLGTRDDIPDLLNIFDIFVLTSISEGLPGAIIEAMATAKPVVCTNVGGCAELVSDGKTGLLVPSGDEKELEKAIIRILDDNNMAAAMGKAGRKFIEEHFSMDQMVRETENLYTTTTG